MEEAAISDSQYVKNCNSFMQGLLWHNIGPNSSKVFYDIILVQIHSGVLENCHFHVFAISSNSSQRPSWTAVT